MCIMYIVGLREYSDTLLEYTISGLVNGVQYEVQVRAVDAAGNSPWSTTGAGTPRTVPAIPAIRSVAAGDQSLTVSWTVPSNTGGSPITAYDLRYITTDASDKADSQWTEHTGIWSSGLLRYTLTGLTNGIEHDVQVRAVNAAGNGLWSQTRTGTASAAREPAASVVLDPSGTVTEGTEITVTMSFTNLEYDSDTADVDYIFRADVKNSANGNADGCEDQQGGYGLGVDRYMKQVDENPEVRTGSISTSCPPGDYTVEVSISSPGNVELASVTAGFTIAAAAQQQPPEPPPSTDATLSGLTLSGVAFGTFDSNTIGYTASVANDVKQTTVTPTTNDDGATYEIKLDGVADADGVIPLAVGRNVITVEVTAEDRNTTRTYTVTVTRAAPPPSTDATLSGLKLRGVAFGTFDSNTIGYTASVANDVTQTTVTPTTNDDGATYEIKLDGVADADGVIPLAVGRNVITVEVTAEDRNTTRTYTVTVTRAAPAADPPATPNRPSGQLTGSGAVSLDWNDVPTATSYEVRFWLATERHYVELSPDAAVHGISITFDGSSAAVSGLPTTDHDGWYFFQVRAINDGGASDWSPNNAIAVPTDGPVPPDTPEPPTGQRTGVGTVTLDWDDVDRATGYQVGLWSHPNLVPLPSDDMPAVKVQMNGSSATLTGLPSGWSHYWFTIRAGNEGGTSGWSSWFALENR